jgi:hypothetical protein
MRITDTEARSYRKKEFGKVLLQHEKEKKDKYLQTCLEMWKDFTPMVYLVDGIAGCKAWNAKKRLATHLASKYNRRYSQMVYYVRILMSIAVVCTNSLYNDANSYPFSNDCRRHHSCRKCKHNPFLSRRNADLHHRRCRRRKHEYYHRVSRQCTYC